MACLVVLLGPGSAAMHATQSAAGGHLDMLSMYLIAAFAAAYAAMRWLGAGIATFVAMFAAGVAFCELVGAWGGEIPVVMSSGNAAFGLLLIVATVLEVLIMRSGEVRARRGSPTPRWPSILTAFAIWNATQGMAVRPTLAGPGPRHLAPARRGGRLPPLPVLRERGSSAAVRDTSDPPQR